MALTENQVNRKIIAGLPHGGITMQIATGETVYAGDLLGVASNYVFPVDSDDAEHGVLIAAEAGTSLQFIQCYWMAFIEGFTGCTSGSAVYPNATAGCYSESADVTGGDSNEIVGYSLTATLIMVLPAVRPFSTA